VKGVSVPEKKDLARHDPLQNEKAKTEKYLAKQRGRKSEARIGASVREKLLISMNGEAQKKQRGGRKHMLPPDGKKETPLT